MHLSFKTVAFIRIYLRGKLDEVCTEWKIKDDTILIAVIYNAVNIVKEPEITFAFWKSRHLRWFVHSLHLVSKNNIKFTLELAHLILKEKVIVPYGK